MEYIIKNGYSVADRGWVVIEGVDHYVLNGFVRCGPSLNHKAWNVTEKKSICAYCKIPKVEEKGQLMIKF
jgi:hypothetical protein